jgi:hypothetical protein
MSDEGTHMILSLFYRDLLKWIIKTKILNFQKIYDFSVSYLIHYPKLQVFYPLLYHLITGVFFYSLFGINEYAARFCSFSFYVASTLMLCFLSKKVTGKYALLSALAFSIYPVSFYISFLAMKDMVAIFFSLLAIYFYLTLKKNNKNFFLLGIVSSLAILSERSGIIIPMVITLHLILKRQKVKHLVVFILGLSALMLPYALVVIKIGGLEISKIIYQKYGFLRQFPIFTTLLLSPLIVLLCSSLFYEKSKEIKRFFSLWFFVAFIIIFFMSFKPRFYQYFLLPLFILSGKFFGKNKKLFVFFVCYSILLNVHFVTSYYLPNYPVREVANYIYNNLPRNANVALISEDGDKLYSSSFMFPLATIDKNKTIVFLRPCYFNNKTREEVLDILKNNGVYFVIVVKDIPEVKNYDKVLMIRDKLEKVFEKNHVEVHRFKEYKPTSKICNYICTTQEVLCTNYDSPFDV